jgi:carbon monoxide dehydrogenase subunit G
MPQDEPVAEVSASVVIAAEAEQVWRFVTDWSRQGEWIPATRVRTLSGEGDALGDRVVARTALGPVGFDDPMEIVRCEQPHLCEVRHLGRVVRGSGTFAVEPAGTARSRFVWTEQLTVPGGRIGELGFRLLRPLTELLLRLALRRLARAAAAPDGG